MAPTNQTDLTLEIRPDGDEFVVWLKGANDEDLWIFGSGDTPDAACEDAAKTVDALRAQIQSV